MEGKPCTIDLNPSMGYNNCLVTNGTSCLTGTTLLYLAHRGRCALGMEHLRVVGFFADPHATKQFPSSLLKDLAGNAFDGGSYLAASIVLLRVLAECHERKQLKGVAPRQLGSRFCPPFGQGLQVPLIQTRNVPKGARSLSLVSPPRPVKKRLFRKTTCNTDAGN